MPELSAGQFLSTVRNNALAQIQHTNVWLTLQFSQMICLERLFKEKDDSIVSVLIKLCSKSFFALTANS